MNSLLPHPGEILKPYLKAKQERRSRYSMRALARDVGLSPGMVSQILSKRKIPSQSSIEGFAHALDIQRADILILKKSAILHAGKRSPAARLLGDYILQDASVLAYRKYRRQNPDSIAILTKWYQFALLDLLTCELPDTDERTLQKFLGITLSEVRDALATLRSGGFIEKRDGRWEKKDLHIELSEEMSRAATRQYHRTMITKAMSVINDQVEEGDVRRRRVIGATLAVDPENVPIAIDMLNKFLFKMTQTLGKGVCREVYQLNFQMVPLSKRTAKSNQGVKK